MTSEKKKNKQHYVWRFYLGAWADENDLIYCHRQGKSFKPNIRDVAQQRNFYKLKELTEEEVKIVKGMIEKSPPHLQGVQNKILFAFTAPHKIRSVIDLTEDSSASILENLDVLINNTEENIHAEIETSSIKYIDSIRAEDVTFWSNSKDRFNFLNFIMLQYFRTRRIQARLSEAIDIQQPDDRRLENTLGVLRHILSLNVAHSVCYDTDYIAVLLMNDSELPFITGDQPVINTYGIDSDLFEAPSEFEVYYPVSPRKAILITNKPEQFSSDTVFVAADKVETYNSLIVRMSHEQLFSNSEALLERIAGSHFDDNITRL